jgi:C-terminal processing protease CtpA/Prc
MPYSGARMAASATQLPTAGIGVVLHPDGNEFRVVEMIKGGAAHTSGRIFADDIIATVDGMASNCRTLNEVTALMTGTVGTDVSVGVRRSGTVMNVSLTRTALDHHATLSALQVTACVDIQCLLWCSVIPHFFSLPLLF